MPTLILPIKGQVLNFWVVFSPSLSIVRILASSLAHNYEPRSRHWWWFGSARNLHVSCRIVRIWVLIKNMHWNGLGVPRHPLCTDFTHFQFYSKNSKNLQLLTSRNDVGVLSCYLALHIIKCLPKYRFLSTLFLQWTEVIVYKLYVSKCVYNLQV